MSNSHLSDAHLAIEAELIKLELDIDACTINSDGTVDVNGNVHIPTGYTSIPVTFGSVFGDFDISDSKLTSLKGAPIYVDVSMYCSNTNIRSLEGAPGEIGHNFYCYNNSKMTSLVGAPVRIGGNFVCSRSNLASLSHAPAFIGGTLFCSDMCEMTVLSILKIRGMQNVMHEASGIIMKHYKPDGTGDIIALQNDLIEAGFGNIARINPR